MQKITYSDSDGTIEMDIDGWDCRCTIGNFRFVVKDEIAEIQVWDGVEWRPVANSGLPRTFITGKSN